MGATSRSSAIISLGGVTIVDDSAFNDPVVEQLEQDYLDRNHLHIRLSFLRRWRGLDESELVTDFIHRKRLIGVIEEKLPNSIFECRPLVASSELLFTDRHTDIYRTQLENAGFCVTPRDESSTFQRVWRTASRDTSRTRRLYE